MPHSGLQGLITPIGCGQWLLKIASGARELSRSQVRCRSEGCVTEMRDTARKLAALLVLGLAALSGACANGGGGGHAVALPAGETCGSIKSQLSRLDAKGVRSSIEAQSAGQRLSAGQKADADAYNSLLNDYLKARCHEMQH